MIVFKYDKIKKRNMKENKKNVGIIKPISTL